MKGQRKSQKSAGSSRDNLRVLLAVLPLPIALSLSLSPEFGDLEITRILFVFAIGLLMGTVTHIYWLRALMRDYDFYGKFYNESAMKPHRNDMKLYKKHTKVLLPFYIFSVLAFIVVLYVLRSLALDFNYLLPLAFGALDGVPLSYYLMRRGIVK